MEEFRRMLIAIVVDEAHVIEDWKDEFRKDYGELDILRICAGAEIPWLALTATCSTRTFEIIYTTLGMGGDRPFYGIDLGSDRPNLKQTVRPMEFPMSSLADLLAYLPESPQSPADFEKTIFYFKSRKLTRSARDMCRAVAGPKFKDCMYAFTATGSEEYKEGVMERLLDDKKGGRWLFATIAAGMGMDIPDIVRVIIFGVDNLKGVFQMGGRAGRGAGTVGEMVWIVEPWAFEKKKPVNPAVSQQKGPTKKAIAEEDKRNKMDAPARKYINLSQSPCCMRRFAISYLRPQPNLPGFKWYSPPDTDIETAEAKLHHCVIWEVENQDIGSLERCGNCSAASCQRDSDKPTGILTDSDHKRIKLHLRTLQKSHSNILDAMPTEAEDIDEDQPPTTGPALRVSKPEREMLREALVSWRDEEWARLRPRFPFFSREWVITEENIGRLVNNAHLILNCTDLNISFIRKLMRTISNDTTLASLHMVLSNFCSARREHDAKEALERQRKRPSITRTVDPTPDPFISPDPKLVLVYQTDGYGCVYLVISTFITYINICEGTLLRKICMPSSSTSRTADTGFFRVLAAFFDVDFTFNFRPTFNV